MMTLDQTGTPYRRGWFIVTLLLGTFTMSLSQSALSTAYPTLMHSFGLSADVIQWLTTGFVLVMCISMPISPWLLNNLSFPAMFTLALGMFDLGTLIIVAAPAAWGAAGFGIMMVGRILEAGGVGLLFPSYQTVLLEITPKDQRATTMGLAGLVMGSALACGPIVAGILLKIFAWQAVFIFFAVVITLVLLVARGGAIRDVLPRRQSELDWCSLVLLLGIIGLMLGIDQIGKPGVAWHWYGAGVLLSLAMLTEFTWRQFHLPQPVLELRVLLNFKYDLAILLTSLAYVALIVTTIIFPLYYQEVLHLSPFWSGLALVPGAALLSLLNPLTGRLADRLGFQPTLMLGMGLIAGGWLLAWWQVASGHLLPMIGAAMVIEGGNAFVMMPAVTLGANALPDALVAHGTAVITTFRQLIGSTGVAVMTLLLTQETQAAVHRGIALLPAAIGGYRQVCLVMLGLAGLGLLLAFGLREHRATI